VARLAKLEEISTGRVLIEQGASGRDLFLILAGKFAVMVNGRIVSQVAAKQYVGKIGMLHSKGRRSASVVAICNSVVARIKPTDFYGLADKCPRLWRTIAIGLALPLRNDAAQNVRSFHAQNDGLKI
jgi:CRP/FNR family transcriptional regulator, cyclic AMP receptor protein